MLTLKFRTVHGEVFTGLLFSDFKDYLDDTQVEFDSDADWWELAPDALLFKCSDGVARLYIGPSSPCTLKDIISFKMPA